MNKVAGSFHRREVSLDKGMEARSSGVCGCVRVPVRACAGACGYALGSAAASSLVAGTSRARQGKMRLQK